MNLDHLVLEDSYVLGISITPYQLELRMDFVLAPEHPKYRFPNVAGQACYQRGFIQIVDFRRLVWSASKLRPSVDAVGEVDFGCIDHFVRNEELVSFSGDWGEIEVSHGSLRVLFEE